jgi:hypothetical protein
MLRALSVPTHPIDRHHLLQQIVKATYKSRRDPAMAQKCREIAELHLTEFPRIAPALKRDIGFLPRVLTFQHYATLLTEAGEFDRAVEVCETAMEYGLGDRTKGGFPARIARIEQARQSSEGDAS